MGKRRQQDHADILKNLEGLGNDDTFGQRMDEVVAAQPSPTEETVKEEPPEPVDEINKVAEGKERGVVLNTPEKKEEGESVPKEKSADLSVEDNLYKKPVVANDRGKGDYHSMSDISNLISSALTSTASTSATNIHMSERTSGFMDQIEKALAFDKNIGKRAKRPMVQRLVIEFFWIHFGDDIQKRIAKGERELSKKLTEL